MIDDIILPVALTAALTAVTIVVRGLPPSGKVSHPEILSRPQSKFKLNSYWTKITQPVPV